MGIEIPIEILEQGAMPAYAGTIGENVGLDCYAISQSYNADLDQMKYGLGFKLAIPQGYGGFLFPRSSISKQDLNMANCVGVIDPGYRGEVSAKFNLIREGKNIYNIGERCCQLIIMKLPKVDLKEVLDIDEYKSDRGSGSYGSTGN